MWQALHEELRPSGFEVVTVAFDSGGAAVARPFIEAANVTHPSLIDAEHVTTQLFGFVNAPSLVWIDEAGTIVRGPDTVYAPPATPIPDAPPDAAPDVVQRVENQRRRAVTGQRYVAAVRDWAAHGAASRYALPVAEVLRRSQPRPVEASLAAAEFALAGVLHRAGRIDAAAAHFLEAHRLEPANWTYKRQAYSLAGDERERLYATDLQREQRKEGAPPLYLPLDL